MLQTIAHSIREACGGARLASGLSSKCRIAADFMLSRLLRFGAISGYNAPRSLLFQNATIHYRFNRGDLQSIREVWLDECYALPFPFEPKTILDLGANIGMTSLWFQQRYHPTHLLAVECDPENAAVARLNYLSNHLPGEVLEAAVGASTGKALFQRSNASNLGTLVSSTASALNDPRAIEVPIISLPDLLSSFEGQSVDLIKMDIEGAEQAVFSSETAWLNQTQALIIEWHEDRMDPAPLIARIIHHGFRHYPANTKHQTNLGAFLRV